MPSLLALLALSASSPAQADTCVDDSELVWVQPATAEFGFAPDSVFRALVGGGTSPASAFTVQLHYKGEPVAATVEVSAHPGEARFEDRYLYTLVPEAPLVEGERYALVIEHESGEAERGQTVSTLVAAEEVAALDDAPSLSVRSVSEDPGAGEGACDFSTRRLYTVDIVPVESDPSERSVLHIYRMETETSEWHYVRAHRVPSDGSVLELELAFERSQDWGDCFVVVQEDGHGQQSLPSAMACAPAALPPASDQGPADPLEELPADSGSRGCSTGGGLAGFAMLWAAVLALATRREH